MLWQILVNNIKHKNTTLYLLFIVIFLAASFSSCKKNENNLISDREFLIAKEIENKKIIMVEDNFHHHPAGYKNIINILDEWLKYSKNSRDKKATLNLILERDDSIALEINRYVHTGDLSVLLDRHLIENAFEDIEFYNQLKYFNDSINIFNSKNHGINIKFNILGFEESGADSSPEYLRRTKREREVWFIKERDSLLSEKIKDYISKNVNERYLIYYGNMHLQKGLVDKSISNISISKDSCMGYCLAGYLANKYGDENVLIIKSKPVAFLTHHIFSLVYSRKVFESSIKKLIILNKYIPSESAVEFSNSLLRKLSYLAGKDLRNVKEVISFNNNKKEFELSYFDSKEFKKFVFNAYSNDIFDNKTRNDLIMLGFHENSFQHPSLDTAEWNNKLWPEELKNIKFINAIGIYQVGYPDEKIKAKEFLKNFSGKDYAEPEKYLQWWRNVYHNYGIE
jgi:hypothetical protein